MLDLNKLLIKYIKINLISLLENIQLAKHLPLTVLIKRGLKKLLPKKNFHYHLSDKRLLTNELLMKSIINTTELPKLNINDRIIEEYLKHTFNYLGSGWINRNHSQNKPQVLEIHSSLSSKISNLIDTDYQFIDWQKEPIANYSFDVHLPYNEQKSRNGVDIKHPWELGRLQHLPRLAFYAVHAQNKDKFIAEFKNLTLDFIANNPIGMGVQWACTMDVGIRVSNLLLAYDIFSQLDEKAILNDEFKKIFTDSIYIHGQFIFNHLEYKEGLTGNHYLFNLAGLIFIGSYLTGNEEIQQWLTFATKEIETEYFKQFFTDGGNFEGSTTYHCLSAEMMVYSTALLMRNNHNFNAEFKSGINKTAAFILSLLKPNGEIPQFGDNDNGRFFKLSYTDLSDDENLLNYEGLMSAFGAIINNPLFSTFRNKFPLEHHILAQLADGKTIESTTTKTSKNYQPSEKGLPNTKTHEIVFDKIENLLDNLSFNHYPDFGISIFKSSNFYLAISTISNKKMHHSWGHVHNDKLSFELFVNGKDVVKDAGSYCYTSNIELRNNFRSTKAHHTAIVNEVEQNKFISSKNGLFYLDTESTCSLLEVTNNSIKLMVKYYGITHLRNFEIFNDKIVITDSCNKPFEQNFNTTILSNGYGKKLF